MNILEVSDLPLTKEEFQTLWDTARPIDREEWGGTAEGAWIAYQFACATGHSFVARRGVLPVAVFGLQDDMTLSGSAWVWFLGSEAELISFKTLRLFMKAARLWLRLCVSSFGNKFLKARLLKTNSKHIKWLRHLGFEFSTRKDICPEFLIMIKGG